MKNNTNNTYWNIIRGIVGNIPENACPMVVGEYMNAIEKVIETYPCSSCRTHFQEYIKENMLIDIKTKKQALLFITNYNNSINTDNNNKNKTKNKNISNYNKKTKYFI